MASGPSTLQLVAQALDVSSAGALRESLSGTRVLAGGEVVGRLVVADDGVAGLVLRQRRRGVRLCVV